MRDDPKGTSVDFTSSFPFQLCVFMQVIKRFWKFKKKEKRKKKSYTYAAENADKTQFDHSVYLHRAVCTDET